MLARLVVALATLLLAAGAARAEQGRVLALGDSYTIGEGVAPAGRWPAQLATLLRAGGMDLAEPEYVARTGWTAGELASALAATAPRGPYALVTLQIGVNDQFRGGDPASFRPALRGLLGSAVALAGGQPTHVVVLSIPDWGATPFAARRDRAAIATGIDAFTGVCRDEAAAAGARWVDVTGPSREVHPEDIGPDGLHPTAACYARWAAAAVAAATPRP